MAQAEIRELCLQAKVTQGLLGEMRSGVTLELPETTALPMTGLWPSWAHNCGRIHSVVLSYPVWAKHTATQGS